MLLKLMPEQVARYWESVFKESLRASLPPIAGETDDKMNNVLESILTGGLIIWLSFTKKETAEVSGMVATQLVADDISRTLSLLVYAVYSPNGTPDREWMEGIAILRKYARSKGCSRIVAYSSNQVLLNRIHQLGGDTSCTFISFDI